MNDKNNGKGANPMKSKEELNALKEEVESERMRILTDDEIKLVSGGE